LGLRDDEGESCKAGTASRGTSGESSEVLTLRRVRGEEDSSSWSDALISVSVVVVWSFEEGGGDGEGDGDGEGGVGVGAGAGAGTTGSGKGCTGTSTKGGSAGRTLENFDAARRRRSQATASNVVRRQFLTARLVVAAASLLPILEISDVVILALLLVLPEQRTTPYSIPKGSLTMSGLKYLTVAIPSSIAVYATLKLTSRGARTSVQPMERVWRVSRRAGMSWVRSSPGSVLAIVGNERLCLGKKVSWCCWRALRRSV